MQFSEGSIHLIAMATGIAGLAVAAALVLAHPDELGAFVDAVRPGEQIAAADSAQDALIASQGTRRRAGPSVELEAGPSGHYHAEIEVNGRSVPVLVDTGATMVALSYEDADRAGLSLNRRDFTQAVSTANGVARVAPVTLARVSIGDITLRNVRASVSEPGRLRTSLLGMSFLGRLTRLDIRQGTLILEE